MVSQTSQSVELFSMHTGQNHLSMVRPGRPLLTSPSQRMDNNKDTRNPMLCGYPSKRCDNWRVEKRNGELHKFCEYHRQKANHNQRRMEKRRKEGKQQDAKTPPPNKQENTMNQSLFLTKHTSDDSLASIFDDQATFFPSNHTFNNYNFDLGMDVNMNMSMEPMDVDMDLNMELLGVDTIAAEPSDIAMDLHETDLFFLEKFIDEIADGKCAFSQNTL